MINGNVQEPEEDAVDSSDPLSHPFDSLTPNFILDATAKAIVWGDIDIIHRCLFISHH